MKTKNYNFRLHKDGVFPTFIFGDFNFRLDTKQVVEYLTASESDLEHVEEDDVGGRVISFVKKSNQQCMLRIETKRFEHAKHEKLFELHEVVKIRA